jgi:hypothetical protein
MLSDFQKVEERLFIDKVIISSAPELKIRRRLRTCSILWYYYFTNYVLGYLHVV